MTTTLVMWSGGIDSTYMLAWLLTHTKDTIHTHHMQLDNKEGRSQAEATAIKKLRLRLESIRPFTFTASTSTITNRKVIPYDMLWVGFHAGALIHHLQDDLNITPTRWTIGTHLDEGHKEDRWQAVETVARNNADPHPMPKFWLPDPLPHKTDEIKFLKSLNLFEDCWYCRTPIHENNTYRPCGACKACVEIQKYDN